MKGILLTFVTISLILVDTNANLRNNSMLAPITVAANYDKIYTGTVYSNLEYIYVYKRINFRTYYPEETRVIVESNATLNFPLIVVVKQKGGVLFWQVPLSENLEYSNTSRTLCSSNINFSNQETVTVSLSTANNAGVGFKLRLISIKDFHIRIGEVRKNIRVSPAEPVYYDYFFDKRSNSKSALVHLESDSEICMIFSVQKKSCPVFDLEKNVEYSDYWQTVSRQGAITVSREKFPDGFFIVLVVKSDDSDCSGILGEVPGKNVLPKPGIPHRSKIVSLSVKSGILSSHYLIVCFSFTSAVIGLSILYIFGLIIYHKMKRSRKPREEQSINDHWEVVSDVTNQTEVELGERNVGNFSQEGNIEGSLSNEVNRKKFEIFVCDFTRKKPMDLTEKSRLYMYYLITVSVFYTLPVMQLVSSNQIILQESGNQDLCYYNFLCARPFGFLSDFNHVFSNLGYILFGILFIFLTRLREKNSEEATTSYIHGLRQNYGLFYAMGIALMMEGVLSGSYHFCPSQNNFQFDSSFMYIMLVLCMVQIYQNRHPDVHPRAPIIFGVLALMIFLALVGVLDGTPVFWIVFTIIHLVFFFSLIAQVYSTGSRRVDKKLCHRFFIMVKHDACLTLKNLLNPLYPLRLFILLLTILLNLGLAISSNINHNKDFAPYLLSILMLNLLLYLFYYIVMKLCYKERILFYPSMFLILAILTWCGSFYFFSRHTTSWALTPAQSRNYNRPCLLFDFFDSHDIWHFLSSLSLFFTFMIFLTLDDDLTDVKISRIPVF